MKKILQYFKNRKTKLDAKLYEEDTDVIIEYKEHYILVFEYVKKNLDGFRYDLDEYRDVQKGDCCSLNLRY